MCSRSGRLGAKGLGQSTPDGSTTDSRKVETLRSEGLSLLTRTRYREESFFHTGVFLSLLLRRRSPGNRVSRRELDRNCLFVVVGILSSRPTLRTFTCLGRLPVETRTSSGPVVEPRSRSTGRVDLPQTFPYTGTSRPWTFRPKFLRKSPRSDHVLILSVHLRHLHPTVPPVPDTS